jgi:hypothetical protein
MTKGCSACTWAGTVETCTAALPGYYLDGTTA